MPRSMIFQNAVWVCLSQESSKPGNVKPSLEMFCGRVLCSRMYDMLQVVFHAKFIAASVFSHFFAEQLGGMYCKVFKIFGCSMPMQDNQVLSNICPDSRICPPHVHDLTTKCLSYVFNLLLSSKCLINLVTVLLKSWACPDGHLQSQLLSTLCP